MNKVLKLRVNNRQGALGEVFHCPHCHYPAATKRGVTTHARMHLDGYVADRNWAIFYSYRVEGRSVAEIADAHELTPGTVYRVIQRGIAYPGIYELAL